MVKQSLSLFLSALLLMACAPKQDTERLICAEADIQTFPYHKDGLCVEKHQTVTPVEGVPGLEVIETFFINFGKPITVQGYELCRTQLRAKDSVVWSLQPSSSAARLDWVLPVTEGFQKENYYYYSLN